MGWSEFPRQWLAVLARLLPQQKTWGDGAVQTGRVDGDMHLDRSTHHSAVHVTHVTHQHFYAAAPASQPPQAGTADAPRLSPEQREVFAQMKRLERNAYIRVLDFMRREFNTALVNELDARQVFRVRRYVEVIQRREETQ